jgi:hypothetical protein
LLRRERRGGNETDLFVGMGLLQWVARWVVLGGEKGDAGGWKRKGDGPFGDHRLTGEEVWSGGAVIWPLGLPVLCRRQGLGPLRVWFPRLALLLAWRRRVWFLRPGLGQLRRDSDQWLDRLLGQGRTV